VLCESLTYTTGLPEVLRGEAVHDHVTAFRPPFDEFEVQRIDVPAGEAVTIPTNRGPLLLLVHAGSGSVEAKPPAASNSSDGASANGGGSGSGSGMAALQRQLELHRGSVVFVPADTGLTFAASATGPLAIWAAAVNAAVFAAPAPVPEAVEAAEEAGVPLEQEQPALVAA
jgi:mannose-6-phosphate isomerase class I